MFDLPKLSFDYNALEPHIDARTMEIHHTKHHQTYVTNLNNSLKDYPDLQRLSVEGLISNLNGVPEAIRTVVRNNGGGHYNHSFFWTLLTPHGGEPKSGAVPQIAEKFGSLDKFKEEFTKAALGRFGSGWAWLSVTKSGELIVTSTANQDSPLMEGHKPVLGLDVWEHAYYLNYQNRRADYISAFWKVLNWDQVDRLLKG